MTDPSPPPGIGLELAFDGPVAILTLDRPDRLNALSHGLVDALCASVEALGKDDRCRAIVLTGAGRAFSSGADLGGGPSDAGAVVREHYNPLIREMTRSPIPLVAAVNGIAAGAGVSLAAACDLRVASETAAFQLSFVKVGLVPDAGATWLLPRIVGLGRAQEMMLLGRKVSAKTAERWGLVNEVVPGDELLEVATATARALADLSSSVGTTKSVVLDGLSDDLDLQLEREATTQGVAQHSPDYQEARAAFREKRKPVFSGASSTHGSGS